MKNNQFELTLETLTPLHIGNGEMLTSVGEFITTKGNIRYLLLDKVNDFLKENNLTDDYTDIIVKNAGGFDTYFTLSNFGIDIEEFIQKEIKLNAKNLNPLNNNILHIFFNSNDKKYIPGSAIKGMLKTVLLYKYLVIHPEYLEYLNKTILDKFEKWDKKEALDWLKKEWNEADKFDSIFEKREFNFLRPSDSSFIQNDFIQVEQVRRQHLFGVESENLDWLQETVEKNTEINFNLTIFPGFKNPFDFLNNEDIGHLLKTINDYSLKMIDFEIDLIQNSSFDNKKVLTDFLSLLKSQITGSDNEYAICRMGKGKTIYFQTILSLLDKTVLKMVVRKFKKENDTTDFFPKTRVLTSFDEMPGWIKIKTATPEIPENEVSDIVEKVSIVNAIVTGQKTVSLTLNGELHENVQLVNPLKLQIRKFQIIQVTVWQINSKGINQVKII